MSCTIDREAEKHVDYVRIRVWDEFTERTNDYIAKISSEDGVLAKKYEQKLHYNTLFFSLINQQYVAPLNETVGYVKALFERSGIGFRLDDITGVQHGYHRMCLIWFVQDKEYVIDVMFDSDQNDPMDSFYRLALLNSCGDVTNGDTITGTINTFDSDPKLPQWFVDGLRHNS